MAAATTKPTTAPATAPFTDWNQRPRDVANVTRWIGRQGERYLHWQIVDLKADHHDLLDAPILYVSGSKAMSFDDDGVTRSSASTSRTAA